MLPSTADAHLSRRVGLRLRVQAGILGNAPFLFMIINLCVTQAKEPPVLVKQYFWACLQKETLEEMNLWGRGPPSQCRLAPPHPQGVSEEGR